MTKEVTKKINVLKFMQKREALMHVLFWVIYLCFPFLKAIGKGGYPSFYSELIDLFFGLIIFYTAYLLFFPSKKKIRNGILLFALFCSVGYLNLKMHNWMFQGTHVEAFWYYSLSYISTYSILALFAYVLYSLKEAYKKQVALDDANLKKQQAELEGLKAQINPHFLFNTLNTIYSSALKNDVKTAELILKLSDNFRYMLHEGQYKYVPLIKEITHLKGYINLQEERLRDKVTVDFNVEIDDDEQEIAPLLLISFVENAFKYISLLKGKNHSLKIGIDLKDKAFKFCCENPFKETDQQHTDAQWQESGIGITNTKKRLAHLYHDKHMLNIENDNSFFKVNLQIQL